MTLRTPELLVETLLLSLYALGAVALTAGGLVAEYASLQYLGAGDLTVALWLAVLGAILLYAGVYALGYRTLLRRFVGPA